VWRPHLREQRDGRRAGFARPPASSLQLDIRAHPQLAEDSNGLGQSRHMLSAEGIAKSVSGVKAPNRCQRQQSGLAATVRRTLEPLIVKQDQLAVRGEADVELDPATIQLLSLTQSGERIFRGTSGGTAMANHRWKHLFNTSSYVHPGVAMWSGLFR